MISNPADHYMYGSCNRLEKATHNRAKIQELTGFDMMDVGPIWSDILFTSHAVASRGPHGRERI